VPQQRRASCHELALALTILVLGSAISRAHHDDILAPGHTPDKLRAIATLDRAAITVSGLSSGGFFAHQFHVTYSGLVNGAGIIAGGPFGCVEHIPNPYYLFWYVPLDRASAATASCSHVYREAWYWFPPAAPNANDSLDFIERAQVEGTIDDRTSIAKHKVWLFHGGEDRVVPRSTVEALKGVYEGLGLHPPQLQIDWNETGRVANHGMPVAQFIGESTYERRACDEHKPPYVVQCGYEAAELLLRHLLGPVAAPSDDPHRDGTLVAFDQSEFFVGDKNRISMHRVGYVYVPNQCHTAQCRLHVAFHGCRQDTDTIQDDFVRDAGYNRWAATNHIVILYPQTTASPNNPERCWDFWGYTDPSNYYGRNGSQMRAVRGMVHRLLGN
jgi:hypothetical protein